MVCPSCLASLPPGYEGLCIDCEASGIEDEELEPEEDYDPPAPPKTGPIRSLVPGLYPRARPYRIRRK